MDAFEGTLNPYLLYSIISRKDLSVPGTTKVVSLIQLILSSRRPWSKLKKKYVSKCLCIWDCPLRDAGCWLLLLQYVTVTKVTNCIPSVGQKSRKGTQSQREAIGVEDR